MISNTVKNNDPTDKENVGLRDVHNLKALSYKLQYNIIY